MLASCISTTSGRSQSIIAVVLGPLAEVVDVRMMDGGLVCCRCMGGVVQKQKNYKAEGERLYV